MGGRQGERGRRGVTLTHPIPSLALPNPPYLPPMLLLISPPHLPPAYSLHTHKAVPRSITEPDGGIASLTGTASCVRGLGGGAEQRERERKED